MNDREDLSRRLAVATDAMNDALTAAEQTLVQLNLGVSASVPMTDSASGIQRRLSFGKMGKDWVLKIEFAEGSGGEPIPIHAASRAMRQEACHLLAALVEELFATTSEQAQGVEAAAVRASEVNWRLRAREGLDGPR